MSTYLPTVELTEKKWTGVDSAEPSLPHVTYLRCLMKPAPPHSAAYEENWHTFNVWCLFIVLWTKFLMISISKERNNSSPSRQHRGSRAAPTDRLPFLSLSCMSCLPPFGSSLLPLVNRRLEC